MDCLEISVSMCTELNRIRIDIRIIILSGPVSRYLGMYISGFIVKNVVSINSLNTCHICLAEVCF